MNKTLKMSFSLKNTYRVNAILFSLKQIPLLKRLFPSTLYKVKGLKIFANVLSILWEIITLFLGKFLYFGFIIWAIDTHYKNLSQNGIFIHILLFLTVVGTFLNNNLVNATKDRYYAINLMRMDAREYTLVNYFYFIFKLIVGFIPFTILFGINKGLPLWFCLLFPLCIAGIKLSIVAINLREYEKRGYAYKENKFSKFMFVWIILFLIIAHIPPFFGFVLPLALSMVILLAFIPLGAISILKLISFREYHAINKEVLAELTNQMDKTVNLKKSNEEKISSDTSISSKRKGFEYLNELFIKRHKKILWNSTKKITCVCILLIVIILAWINIQPSIKTKVNEVIITWLPYCTFVMYTINRGSMFTQALFMNCDHSLFTYSFFKQPKFILKLFKIRLREIIKINIVPALAIGIGLALILFASGGSDNPLNYLVLIVSILCMSLFFSIHYLTIYYLLQPYNIGTELTSGTYQIVSILTYVSCYALMKLRMPTLIFGLITIIFCVIYSLIASVLIYRLAPKTFKLRT